MQLIARSRGSAGELLNFSPFAWLQVLDSPFSKLTDLMLELVEEQRLPIPRALYKMALGMMRRSVKKRAHFNIDTVSPIDVVQESYIPALFGELSHAALIAWATVLQQDRAFLDNFSMMISGLYVVSRAAVAKRLACIALRQTFQAFIHLPVWGLLHWQEGLHTHMILQGASCALRTCKLAWHAHAYRG